jgi:N6-adenosine-specific RNA methylase IME4
MWTTIPHEAIAHRVLELRCFKYVSQRIWDKIRPGSGRGPGYWVTGEHEILLIAVRGDVVAPATAHFRSRFEAPVGEHSEKPDQQYEHAEYHFPNIPKIELNARRARPGWQSWGYEAPLPKNDPGGGPALDIPNFLPSWEPVSDYPELPDRLKRSARNVAPFCGGP